MVPDSPGELDLGCRCVGVYAMLRGSSVPDPPCDRQATQEDGLCDECRSGTKHTDFMGCAAWGKPLREKYGAAYDEAKEV